MLCVPYPAVKHAHVVHYAYAQLVAQTKLADAACSMVTEEYKNLEAAIFDASKRGTQYVQPWKTKKVLATV